MIAPVTLSLSAVKEISVSVSGWAGLGGKGTFRAAARANLTRDREGVAGDFGGRVFDAS
jgi:hypothetical protein